MNETWFVAYSLLANRYTMIAAGDDRVRRRMQEIINANGSDWVISEVTFEEYSKVRNGMELKYTIK